MSKMYDNSDHLLFRVHFLKHLCMSNRRHVQIHRKCNKEYLSNPPISKDVPVPQWNCAGLKVYDPITFGLIHRNGVFGIR